MKRVLLSALLAGVILAAPAVADTYNWTGAISSDFNSNGNWTTNGVVAESIPASNDNVIIDSGAVDITAGLNQSGVDYDSFIVGPNYTGVIGNSTSDRLRLAADLVVFAGGGEDHYIRCEAPGCDEVIIRRVGSGTDDLYLDGAITTLTAQQGKIYLASTATVTTLTVDPLNASAGNVTLTSAATITSLYQRTGSTTITGGTTTTAYIDAGTATVTGGTWTNLIQRGGTVTWSTTGTLTSALIFAGVFDASQDVQAKTITSLASYGAASVSLDNAVGNVAVTNGVKAYGGTVSFPAGQVISY